MKKQAFSRFVAVVLTIAICLSMGVAALAVTDAAAPLNSLNVQTAKADDYKLSPAFQKNTQVYTVTPKTATGTMPTTVAEALGIIEFTTPEGTNTTTAFDTRTQTLTITTVKDGNSSRYYVTFSDISEANKTDTADINVKKILEADANAKLDSILFTYELIPQKIVANTAPAGVTAIPLANAVGEDADLADTTLPTTPADGIVNVTTTAGVQSVMTFDGWENVTTTLSAADAATAGRTDLTGKPVVDGTFSVQYTKVGQYVYLLHEVKGDETGVIYDETYYEVIVSVVNEDPANPNGNVVIGWIEVNKLDDINAYQDDPTTATKTKVNFGQPGGTIVDGEKYDNMTTSITYPFINVLATEDLLITKTVTGDLGDKDQEFLFELTIVGDRTLAKEYVISYTTGASAANPEKIETELTDLNDPATPADDSDDQSVGTVLFTLKHGETATVAELPVGLTYTITELVDDKNNTLASASEAANYNTTITYDKSLTTQADVDLGTANAINLPKSEVVVGKEVADQKILNTDKDIDKNIVGVVNDKPLTPPTGTFMDMVPYVALVMVALCGFVGFVVISKRKSTYEK